jgi:hypothetical protein
MLQRMSERDGPKFDWRNLFGRGASAADIKRTFWDDSRVKHDPADTESKDWASSEPDPDAP